MYPSSSLLSSLSSILVFCINAIVYTTAEGYNYHQPNSQGLLAFQAVTNPTFNNNGIGSVTSFGSTAGFVSSSRFQLQQQQQQQQGPAIVSKHFYIHSAPDETEEDLRQQTINVGQPRKHYNVVFIKTSSTSPKAAALSLSQAQTEEKTVIYVLTKKTDAADIQAAIQAAPTQPPAKPEVFFIKYRTLEEAQHAQHQIQAQYDALGGSTQISDEGVAPVSSVVGSLGSTSSSGTPSSIINSGIVGGSISGPPYLPPHP